MARKGRPKKEIVKQQFESLCGIQCTKQEICDVLDCDEKTLTRWCKETYRMGFSDVLKQKKEVGKASLRRMQWEKAKNSTGMLIWLGKQYLGQKDEQAIDVKTDNIPQITVNLGRQKEE